jgi:hypothetical protein
MSETGRAKRGQRGARIAGAVFGTVFALAGAVAGVMIVRRVEGPQRLAGLIPAVFVLAGVGIVVASLRGGRGRPAPPRGPSQRAAQADRVAGLPAGAREPLETRELKPAATPATRLAGGLLFTLFWNGVVSVFVVQAVNGWRAGERPWFLSLFMVPFVVVGLGGVGFVVHAFLALFNPRPRLRLSPGTLRLGERAQIEWEVDGAAHRLRKLTLTLEGREEATYRRGTDTHTDREVFARIAITQRAAGELRRGSERITVPAETMHSFEAPNNKVVWLLRVHGEIRLWPDVSEEYPVVVLPRGERA